MSDLGIRYQSNIELSLAKIHKICLWNDQESLVNALNEDSSCLLEVTGSHSLTCLHIAVFFKDLKQFQVLLQYPEAREIISWRDDCGKTPLEYAVEYYLYEFVIIIVELIGPENLGCEQNLITFLLEYPLFKTPDNLSVDEISHANAGVCKIYDVKRRCRECIRQLMSWENRNAPGGSGRVIDIRDRFKTLDLNSCEWRDQTRFHYGRKYSRSRISWEYKTHPLIQAIKTRDRELFMIVYTLLPASCPWTSQVVWDLLMHALASADWGIIDMVFSNIGAEGLLREHIEDPAISKYLIYKFVCGQKVIALSYLLCRFPHLNTLMQASHPDEYVMIGNYNLWSVEKKATRIFVMTVMHADSYYRIREGSYKTRSFFAINQHLPLELKMLIAVYTENRRGLINSKKFENELRWLLAEKIEIL